MENSKLIKKIKSLKDEIRPQAEWVNASRNILLNQIKSECQNSPVKLGVFDYADLYFGFIRKALTQPALVMLLVFATFLGSSLTINAAFYSLPGTSLHKVKLAMEKTQLYMSSDEKRQVELKIEFAQKRFDELNKVALQSDLTASEKDRQIEVAVKEFKNNILAVNSHLNKLKQTIVENNSNEADKDKTVKMAMSISSQAQEMAKDLDKKIEVLSESEKIEVKQIVAEMNQTSKDTTQAVEDLNEAANKEDEASGVNDQNSTDTPEISDSAGHGTSTDNQLAN